MVLGSPRTTDGGAGGSGSGNQGIPVGVKKTVQSIKEIVRNHSEAEIYAMLKETNMDPNETTQKLLNQDPFHEVKRKRDKKKEQAGYIADTRRPFDTRRPIEQAGPGVFTDTRRPIEQAGPGVFTDTRRPIEQAGPGVFTDTRRPIEQAGPRVFVDNRKPMEQAGRVFTDIRRPMEQAGHRVFPDNRRPMEQAGHRFFPDNRRPMEQNVQWLKPHAYWDRNAVRGGYNRGAITGVSREFRVVRDNRVINSDPKPETAQPQDLGQQVLINVSQKNSAEVFTKQKQSDSMNPKRNISTQGVKEPRVSGSLGAKSIGLNASDSLLLPEESQKTDSGSTLRVQGEVKNSSSAALTSSTSTSTNSVVGVYSSSSDPVHVPSPDSRTAGTVGAIRREVGAVGVRRLSSDRLSANSLVSNKTHSISSLRKDIPPPLAESVGHTTSLSKSAQSSQTAASNTNTPSISSRPSTNSQHNNKLHQQSAGHQKAVAPSMEWKPKSSKKSSEVAMPTTISSSCADTSTSSVPVDATGLSEKLSQVNVAEKQHVIIPQHLRVPEFELTRLTFGSFGDEFDSSKGLIFGTIGLSDDRSLSVSTLIPVGSGEDASPAHEGDYVDDQESDSPTSEAESDQPPSGNNESFTENMDSYAEIGLVQSHSPPYSSSELPQLQNPSSLPNFSAYNTVPTNYPFFRTVLDDNMRGEVLASSSEIHAAISIAPAVAVSQQQPVQQQQSVAQMYPQLQISPFPNFVPYRQMFSPVYVPPMAMPNYPNTPSYPHPSNGSSYLLMPGGSSHLTSGGIKYAASQYKPVPAGTPGYGNFTNPGGFTISTPASIGTATGLEDVSRIKYKDTNLYVPNAQQGESTDIWIQPPREVPGLQSAPYYNLPGQAAHPAFMQTHGGSFNATSQPSHVQYPGLYHQPQPGSIPNPHHMVHQQVNQGFGGGVGVGVAAPGPQVGTYPQAHLNWAPNF